jgi:hypothetical protein
VRLHATNVINVAILLLIVQKLDVNRIQVYKLRIITKRTRILRKIQHKQEKIRIHIITQHLITIIRIIIIRVILRNKNKDNKEKRKPVHNVVFRVDILINLHAE